MTPEHRAFLRAIIAGPEDDLPRLIYADWLEENGKAIQARFIRKQIARVPSTVPLSCVPAALETLFGVEPHRMFNKGSQTDTLIAAYGESPCLAIYKRGFVHEIRVPTLATLFGGPCTRCDGSGCTFCGGEDRDYHTQCNECVCSGSGRIPGIAAQLFAEHPVMTVRVADREPASTLRDNRYWRRLEDILEEDQNGQRSLITAGVFDLIVGGETHGPSEAFGGVSNKLFRFREAALDALSAAIIAHGRAMAYP